MLVAAASNQCHGGDIMNYVLPRSQNLGDYTRVAEVAASNVTQAIRIIRQLVDRGSRITVTPQLHKNAFESGCYKDVLGLFMHCPRTGSSMRGEAAAVDAIERQTAVVSARTIFRGIAKFLISRATHDDNIYDTLRQSGRQIEAHGYSFLEHLILCAVEVFRVEGSSGSKLREQFLKRTGTLNWVADESGFDLWITRGVVKASIEGQFFDWIRFFFGNIRETLCASTQMPLQRYLPYVTNPITIALRLGRSISCNIEEGNCGTIRWCWGHSGKCTASRKAGD
ncbi:hypothetical protein HDV57DRAFT_161236 [Trichoderma longibrachiatum]